METLAPIFEMNNRDMSITYADGKEFTIPTS